MQVQWHSTMMYSIPYTRVLPVHIIKVLTKAEFAEGGIFFANRFPSLGIFVNKKVGN